MTEKGDAIYLKPEDAWRGFTTHKLELQQQDRVIAQAMDGNVRIALGSNSSGSMAVVRVYEGGFPVYEHYCPDGEDLHDELVYLYDQYMDIEIDYDEHSYVEEVVYSQLYELVEYLVPSFKDIPKDEVTETVDELVGMVQDYLLERGYPIIA